jgi:3D (Asp-Asp-Asp) domain-containing protein
MPPSGTQYDEHTVAYGEVDRVPFIGVNSGAPGYTEADRTAADQMRERLIAKHPEIMKSGNVGQKPNDALYHAEATGLMRAARDSGGHLRGRSIEIYVDRALCPSCRAVLPKVAEELGNPLVTIGSRAEPEQVMRHGDWLR